ncbi:adenylate/guanylate cyclase domain-containing protein [Verrucomicrobia bacterium]|nr:adenylate/guanylate cyclase domain-containing protein [Verrucomicrobiota bacterium]MDA7866552.1 adenylate/guanylate cyclase domain-containing protein [Verrucomicrobiota bacterium]
MNFNNQWQRNRVGALLSILLSVTAGLVVGEYDLSISTKLKYLSYDLPFVIRSGIESYLPNSDSQSPDDVVLVYLDDVSHQQLDQPYNAPWDRRHHAALLDRLTAEGAKAVVFDIIFTDPSPQDPEADAIFAQAIEENGRVILATDLLQSDSGQGGNMMEQIVIPYDPFDANCAEIGFSAVHQNSDQEVRQHYHSPEMNELFESLTWATARFLGAEVTKDDSTRTMDRWINYYGPPRSLPHYSFHEVITENALTGTPFKDKIVYVGAHLITYNSGERKDEFFHPWSSWGLSTSAGRFMPGVEVHSTILLNLLRQDWITQVPLRLEMIFLIVMGTLLGGGLVLLRPLTATFVAIATALLVTLIATYLHWIQRLWFPWAIFVVVQLPIAWIVSVVFNSVKLYVQKQLLEQSIRAYLSPKLVKAFSSRQDENFLKPGAKKQELSILFSDIEGFTSLSEGMDSSELAKLMNGYFETTVSHGIHATDGTVVKYIGDAIFAFWNAPEPQNDHATRACEAAIQIQNQPYRFSESKPINTRIGIHSGSADVGNFGSENRVDYTAIGENINLAARLEGLNKHLGTRTLISIDTRNAASPSILTRDLGKFRLKGFERTVHVFELLSSNDATAADLSTFSLNFTKALEHFQAKEFDQAEKSFQESHSSRPDDGPSEFFLRQIESFRQTPPSPDWQGEVQLDEK